MLNYKIKMSTWNTKTIKDMQNKKKTERKKKIKWERGKKMRDKNALRKLNNENEDQEYVSVE